MTAHTGNETSSLRIGTVTAVRGRRIEITVDVDKNDSSLIFQGEIISNVSIGSFLVIRRGYAHLVVQVEEEELIESNAWENSSYQRDVDRNTRILKTALLGEFETDTSVSPFQTRFITGSQTSPLIGNIAYLASPEQASKIYVSTSEPGTQITIGHLATNSSIPINLDISTFFSSHIGIFGNTGSGKSYSLTQLYTQLFKKISNIHPNERKFDQSRFILFDFNGEYCSGSLDHILCSPELKLVYGPIVRRSEDYPPNTRQIPLLIDNFYYVNFWTTILEATEHTQRPFILKCLQNTVSTDNMRQILHDLILSYLSAHHTESSAAQTLLSFLEDIFHLTTPNSSLYFRHVFTDFSNSLIFNKGAGSFALGVDNKPFYADSKEFEQRVDDFLNKMYFLPFYGTLDTLTKIALNFKFHYIDELITNSASVDNLQPLMTRFDNRLITLRKWFEVRCDSDWSMPLLQIINLADATLDERQLIPLIIARTEYDAQKDKSRRSHGQFYLNFIIEEAHTILARETRRESEQWRNTRLDTFEEIIMEGRKFGTFITLLSQRPANISPIFTSQLHHHFLHRLIDSDDLDCVKDTVSFLDKASFESIPFLPCGTCIISGTASPIPAVVKIDELPEGRRPNNETIDLVKLWGLDSDPAGEDDSDSSVSTSTRAESAADADSTRAFDT